MPTIQSLFTEALVSCGMWSLASTIQVHYFKLHPLNKAYFSALLTMVSFVMYYKCYTAQDQKKNSHNLLKVMDK